MVQRTPRQWLAAKGCFLLLLLVLLQVHSISVIMLLLSASLVIQGCQGCNTWQVQEA
jgi:hypothetical protein